MQYAKVKSVSKMVLPKGPDLEKVVLATMKTAADMVGATLGPGGAPVLIERQEDGLPPMVTKDGVTVYRSLGFQGSIAQVVMEAARDASVRTAQEAGDGTTTATVLSEAIVRLSSRYIKSHPKASPQRVVRILQKAFQKVVEPTLKNAVSHISSFEDKQSILRSIAKTSANGDQDLAEAVVQCFDLVGDEGNVTISELSGSSGYEVEKVEGFPIPIGFEESCQKFYSKFINDPANQRAYLERPMFLVYHGRLNDMQGLRHLFEVVFEKWQKEGASHNIVIVATGFSEGVLGALAHNFEDTTTMNVFPLLAPQSPMLNGQLGFLEDVAAITGAKLMDPLNNPIESMEFEDLGFGEGLKQFESTRYRSNIVGYADEESVLEQVDVINAMLQNPGSELDESLLRERLGKISGGIARLKVVGSSGGETKEKRDRAEDAVCAVRGAIKSGCLPGGGWGLLKAIDELSNTELLNQEEKLVVQEILQPALLEPVHRLLANCGYSDDESAEILRPVISSLKEEKPVVFDAYAGLHVDPFEAGVLDSAPAVMEAVKNALSIASLLGTLGGTVVFQRDADLERQESRDIRSFLNDSNADMTGNPANNRA